MRVIYTSSTTLVVGDQPETWERDKLACRQDVFRQVAEAVLKPRGYILITSEQVHSIVGFKFDERRAYVFCAELEEYNP